MNPFEGREIWFLTGSQSLYGPDTLDLVAQQSRQVAGALADGPEIPAQISWRPVLTTADDITAALRVPGLLKPGAVPAIMAI